MKKLIALTIAVLTAGVLTVNAAENSKDDLALRSKLAAEMLDTMEVGKALESSFDSIKEMQAQMIKKMVKRAADQEKAVKLQSQIIDLMKKELTWEKLKPEFVKLYAETFSAEELKGLIEFNKSPVGQKFIEKQPEMQRKSMMLVQKMVMDVMPKIQELTKKMMQQEAIAAKAKPQTTCSCCSGKEEKCSEKAETECKKADCKTKECKVEKSADTTK